MAGFFHVRGFRGFPARWMFVVLLEVGLSLPAEILGDGNYALRFDGVDDYVEVAHSPSLVFDREISLMVWVFLEQDATEGIVLDKWRYAEENVVLGIGERIGFYLYPRMQNQEAMSSSTTILRDRWVHIACTCNSEVARIYLDGVLDREMVVNNTNIGSSDAPMRIGAIFRWDVPPLWPPIKGKLDELAIYNRALSAQEIFGTMRRKLAGNEPGLVAYYDFDEGTGQTISDKSGHGNHGRLGETPEADANDPSWVSSEAPNPPLIFTFDSGPGSDFSVVNAGGLYAIDQDGPDLRISKPVDDGTILPTGYTPGGIISNFAIEGDFTITVDFALHDFPQPPEPQHMNESILGVVAPGCRSFWVLRVWEGSGDFVQVYSTVHSGRPEIGEGVQLPSSDPAGYYRITRSGSRVSGYFAAAGEAFTELFSVDDFPEPVRVHLLARQGPNAFLGTRPTTAIDISFDNLVVEAERIVRDQGGLVGWWKADGDARDGSGNGNNGTWQNGEAYAAGISGRAFQFDGMDDMVVVPDSPSLRPEQLTVAAWVKFASLESQRYGALVDFPGYQYIIFKRNPRLGSFEDFSLIKAGNPDGVFWIGVAPEATMQGNGAASLTRVVAGQWYHVAATYDGSAIRLYVNGVMEGEVPYAYPLYHSSQPLVIGRSGEEIHDAAFNGLIDDVRIYNRALSCVEIEALYVNALPLPNVPSVPSGFKAVIDNQGGVQLTWDAVTGVTGYVVERCVGGAASCAAGGTWEKPPGGDVPSDVTTFTDPNPPVGEVCYRVSAVNAAGASVPTAEGCVMSGQQKAPDPPEPVTVEYKPNGSDSAIVRWGIPKGDVTKFLIERRRETCEWVTIIEVASNVTFYQDWYLPYGKQICYRVVAINSFGASAPTQPACFQVPGVTAWKRNLKIFVPGSPEEPGVWTDFQDCDQGFKKIFGIAIIIHGWNWKGSSVYWDGDLNANSKGQPHYSREIAQQVSLRFNGEINVLAWDWLWAATSPLDLFDFSVSECSPQAVQLANWLKILLPEGYGQPIHILGHSLGTLVGSEACLELLEPRLSDPETFRVKQMTLWDPPDAVPYNVGIVVENNLTDRVQQLRARGVYVDLYSGMTNRGTHFANFMVDVPGDGHDVFNWYRGTIPAGNDPRLFLPQGEADPNGTIGFGTSVLLGLSTSRPNDGCVNGFGILQFAHPKAWVGERSQDFQLTKYQCAIWDEPTRELIQSFNAGSFGGDCDPLGCVSQSPTSLALATGSAAAQGGGGAADLIASFSLPLVIDPAWDLLSFHYNFTTAPIPATLSLAISSGEETTVGWSMSSGQTVRGELVDSRRIAIAQFQDQAVTLRFELACAEAGAQVVIQDLTFWQSPTHSNRPPEVEAGPNQVVGVTPDGVARVTLNGSATRDPDGDALTYEWLLDGELLATEVSATVTLPPGRYPIVLTARDPLDAVGTDGVEVTVEGRFIRGDSNGDGMVDISDAIKTLFCKFVNPDEYCPACFDAMDVDDDGILNGVTDAVYILTFLFLNGPAPPEPYPLEGLDETADQLSCFGE